MKSPFTFFARLFENQKNTRNNWLFVGSISLLLLSFTAQAETRPAADYLLPDGTINTAATLGQSLTLDLAGWNVTLDPERGPVFNPAPPPPDTWNTLNKGLYGNVSALAVIGTDIYVGGQFNDVGAGGTAVPGLNSIAKWNGTAWSALDKGLNSGVNAFAVIGTDLYVGGGFNDVGAGGTAVPGLSRIAKWNGTAWSALDKGLIVLVYALAVVGTDLYAGGLFTAVGTGGTAVPGLNHIAKWNGTTWSALDKGLNSTVRALAVRGTDLYAGGAFMDVGAGGTAVPGLNNIAKWNGTAWSALDKGLNDVVIALAVSGTDLYVGGLFRDVGTGGTIVSGLSRIAKWNGTAWLALDKGLNERVFALAVRGTDLYVGGLFTDVGTGGTAVSGLSRIAKWNGMAWSALDKGLNSNVRALAVSGTDLYVGGDFTAVGTGGTAVTGLNAIAKWGNPCPDNIPPSITCPANIVRSNDAGQCSASVTYTTPTALYNCGLPTAPPQWISGGTMLTSSGINSISTFQKGATIVTWKATDGAGLTKTCTFRVTINDTQAPTLTCPASMNLSTATNTCNAVATYTNPSFTDNCAPTNGTSTRISGLSSGSTFQVGSSNVVFQATDAAGNTRRCTMVVTVADNQAPVINCPTAVVVNGSGTPCTATVFYGSTTASDNCAATLTPFLFTGLASGSSFPAGVTTNTFRAIAPNGQSSECSFSVTVNCGSGMGNNGVEVRDADLSIQHSDKLELKLAPNPALSTVTVSIAGVGSGGGTLLVFDAVGRLVLRQVIAENQQTTVFQVDGSAFAPGIYRVNLRTEHGMVTKTLVVVK